MINKLGNLSKRVLVGSTAFYIFMAGLYFGSFFLVFLMGLLCWHITTEYINIVRKKGINPSNKWIKFISYAFLITVSLPYFGYDHDLAVNLLLIVLLFGVSGCFLRLVFRGGTKEKIATIPDISTSVLGFIYTGLLPSFLILLQQTGFAYAVIACFSTSFCDTGAYFGGKFFGKHKLKPEISPKKTLEGAIAGLIASICGALLVFYISPLSFNYNVIHPIVIGIVCGTLSQFGDLFESLLKRDAGVKDSGSILLSHGGVLDRIDSYLFILWLIYFYVRWLIL